MGLAVTMENPPLIFSALKTWLLFAMHGSSLVTVLAMDSFPMYEFDTPLFGFALSIFVE